MTKSSFRCSLSCYLPHQLYCLKSPARGRVINKSRLLVAGINLAGEKEVKKRCLNDMTVWVERNGREARNHNVLIYLCVDMNGEVKDLHRKFNIR